MLSQFFMNYSPPEIIKTGFDKQLPSYDEALALALQNLSHKTMYMIWKDFCRWPRASGGNKLHYYQKILAFILSGERGAWYHVADRNPKASKLALTQPPPMLVRSWGNPKIIQKKHNRSSLCNPWGNTERLVSVIGLAPLGAS
uniref:Uncharacterized protein n=1 Tax=Schistocephalus solidus TaxID=70667 RepID=A0A0X3PKX6_SCHSO